MLEYSILERTRAANMLGFSRGPCSSVFEPPRRLSALEYPFSSTRGLQDALAHSMTLFARAQATNSFCLSPLPPVFVVSWVSSLYQWLYCMRFGVFKNFSGVRAR